MRTQKGQKSPKAQKWKMAWEWGTNEYFCLPYVTILWCPSQELPEDRGKKWNSYSWHQKSYLDFEILVSIFLNWTTLNVWKFIYCLREIHISRRIQHGVFIIKQSVNQGRNLSRGLGSPGSRQLLRLQLFSPNLLNFGPPVMI